MSGYDQLEKQLREVIRSHPDHERPVASRPRLRRGLRVLPVLAAACLSVAVVVVALVELRAGPTVAPSAGGASNSVMGLLGVLHTPETSADRTVAAAAQLEAENGDYLTMRPLVREATRAPWGPEIFLLAPPVDGSPRVSAHFRPHDALAFIGEMVGVSGSPRPNQVQNFVGITAASVKDGSAIYVQAASSEPYASPQFADRTDVAVVVPDGVAAVEFVLPRQPVPIVGAPTYPHIRYLTVAVHNNVAAAVLDQFCCYRPGDDTGLLVDPLAPAAPPMIWLGRDGRIIKQVGDVAAAGQIRRLPAATPETPLSRAAERNAVTRNPVWISPSKGSPDTDFYVHFRVLLTGAEYYYSLTREGRQLTPDAASNCAPPRGASGPIAEPITNMEVPAGLHPNSVRGTVWTDLLVVDSTRVNGRPAPPPLCPGTYRVEVGVANRGVFAHGTTYIGPPYPSSAFGTATFVVKPASRSHAVIYVVAGLVLLVLVLATLGRRRKRRIAS
ncbi:MAG: hypothetical protein JO027_11485 [Solirubrobacterales bacterium]|nr:hypothetical protein [Solirubrobacterales bacterium]